MKYLILVHDRKEIRDIANIFANKFNVQYSHDYIDIVFDESSYVTLEYCQNLGDEFDEQDRLVFSGLNLPMYSFVRYNNLSFLQIVLGIIVRNINCYIDNDLGILLQGREFMEKLTQSPSYSWNLEL